MARFIQAVYENGVFRPTTPVPDLAEGQPVYLVVSVVITDPEEIKRREAALVRQLEAEGLLVRFAVPDGPPPGDWQPLVIEGKPLSETILEDRR